MITRVLAVAAAVAVALPAFAEPPPVREQPRDYACAGGQVPSVVRWSEIKPTGSADGFRQAVRDNLRWYRDHGYPQDQIEAYPVDLKGRPSARWFMVVHRDYTEVSSDQQDAAWKAFVAAYGANADVREQQLVCLPRDGRSKAPPTLPAVRPPFEPAWRPRWDR